MVNVNRSWSASLVLLAAVSAVGCGSVISDDDVDVVEDNADGEPGEVGEADEAGEAGEAAEEGAEGAEGAADGDADVDADADAADADADADADACSDGYLDPASGLCWWRGLEDPFVYSMEEAASRCATEGGRRVPTIGELRTLVRGCPASEPGGSCPEDATYCDGCPRLPPWDCLWPPEMGTWTCEYAGYLSSTPSGDSRAPALCLSFGAAIIAPCVIPDGPAVICVREGGG
jgi:hypothetical protein